MENNFEHALQNLNDMQRGAVMHTEGPLLILAGAGTGKTKVLTTRLAHLIASGKAYPNQILAVTFTNKAAKEMRERVGGLIGGYAEQLWLGTFHSLSTRILRKHAEHLGLKSNFTILDTDDQLRLIKQIYKEESIDEKRYVPKLILNTISRFKDKAFRADNLPASETSKLEGGTIIAHIYKKYQARLIDLNAVDFGDLLLHTITLFQSQPTVLETYQNLFKYIMVDEYQDTNVAQYLWLRLLSGMHKNICCVGDDDQSIYGWRGAEITNILRFSEDFKGAEVIRLEQNYRSTQNILKAASALIDHNTGRLGKTLWTSDGDGEKIHVHSAYDGGSEASFIVSEIEKIFKTGQKLGSMAILIRASFQSREFEEHFLNKGIPYKVLGGLRFYERLEIRDALAYLRLVDDPNDSLAFERVVNMPKRALGPSTLQRIHDKARELHISLFTASRELILSGALKPQAAKNLKAFTDLIEDAHLKSRETKPCDIAENILEKSGYFNHWRTDKTVEAPGRLENLKELITALGEFENLQDFLEHVSLVIDAAGSDTDDGDVLIMTLHGAKGLEFDTVFLPGWEENIFPHARSLQESNDMGLEEERRLAYVGITRARKKAYISFAANRRMYGSWQSALPSRFIKELPQDVTTMTKEGLFQVERPEPRNFARPKSYGSAAPAAAASYAPAQSHDFHVGNRIKHDIFGIGIIKKISGDAATIYFQKSGETKKLMTRFIEKA